MFARIRKYGSITLVASALTLAGAGVASAQNAVQPAPDSGIVRVKSAYSVAETVARLKNDVAGKGIRFFLESIKPSWRPTPASSCGRRRC